MILTALLSAMYASAASAGWFEDNCTHTAVRTAVVPAAGIQRIVIDSGAGLLRVEGRDGATAVNVRGNACTSDSDYLPSMQVKTTRSGNDLRIETVMPERFVLFNFFEARIDLTVLLPTNIPVVIDDGSGSVVVQNVAAMSIDDGSGSLEIRNVRGNVSINDGSGSIDVSGVGGEVRVSDGSGTILVNNAGSVLVEEDGSGSIQISDVKRGVKIDDDGSGSISVTGVGGDFTVNDKGSGGISYDKIAGKVTLPRDRD
jgi:hypothetical protein